MKRVLSMLLLTTLAAPVLAGNNDSFFQAMSNKVAFTQNLTNQEAAKLLALSSEADTYVSATVIDSITEVASSVDLDSTDLSSENPEIAKLNAVEFEKKRRTYDNLSNLRQPQPFYRSYNQGRTMAQKGDIQMVRERQNNARNKLLRYRAIYPAYGR